MSKTDPSEPRWGGGLVVVGEEKGCPLAFVIHWWSLCVRERKKERASWMLWSRRSAREEKKKEKWR